MEKEKCYCLLFSFLSLILNIINGFSIIYFLNKIDENINNYSYLFCFSYIFPLFLCGNIYLDSYVTYITKISLINICTSFIILVLMTFTDLKFLISYYVGYVLSLSLYFIPKLVEFYKKNILLFLYYVFISTMIMVFNNESDKTFYLICISTSIIYIAFCYQIITISSDITRFNICYKICIFVLSLINMTFIFINSKINFINYDNISNYLIICYFNLIIYCFLFMVYNYGYYYSKNRIINENYL